MSEVRSKSESKPKRSAEAIAALRFAGTFERPPEVRNPDSLSRHFLGPTYSLLARFGLLRRIAVPITKRAFPGGLEYHIARTRHFDRVLLEELDAGTTQVVLLGAGYDTRAHRFADRLRGTAVFELDLPATAERKLSLIRRRLGSAPGRVTYVPIDFERHTLAEALGATAYDPGAQTLFLWEGVTYFITEEAIDGTLAFIAGSAGSRSSVAFDYIVEGAIEDPSAYYGGKEAAGFMLKGGEPWLFGLSHEDVEPFLRARGFELVSKLEAQDLEDAYLRRADGRLHARVSAFLGIALARVGGGRIARIESPRTFV